jgi:hypothetical protein
VGKYSKQVGVFFHYMAGYTETTTQNVPENSTGLLLCSSDLLLQGLDVGGQLFPAFLQSPRKCM